MGYGNRVGGCGLAEDRDRRRAFVNTVMNQPSGITESRELFDQPNYSPINTSTWSLFHGISRTVCEDHAWFQHSPVVLNALLRSIHRRLRRHIILQRVQTRSVTHPGGCGRMVLFLITLGFPGFHRGPTAIQLLGPLVLHSSFYLVGQN
jgi:hypothetical protein